MKREKKSENFLQTLTYGQDGIGVGGGVSGGDAGEGDGEVHVVSLGTVLREASLEGGRRGGNNTRLRNTAEVSLNQVSKRVVVHVCSSSSSSSRSQVGNDIQETHLHA